MQVLGTTHQSTEMREGWKEERAEMATPSI
jgi:hypothetical protein